MFDLRRIAVFAVIFAVVSFGFDRSVSAQTSVVVRTQGVLSAVTDNGNGVTLTASVRTQAGTQSFVVSRVNTAVWAGNEKISPNVLDRFIGAAATVLSTPVGNQQVAGQIRILVFPFHGNVTQSLSRDDSGGGNGGGGNGGGGNGGGGNGGGGNGGGGNGGGGNGGGGNGGGGNGNHGNGQGSGSGKGVGEQGDKGFGHGDGGKQK